MLEILSRPTQDLLNSNFRTAKAGYFDSNFSPSCRCSRRRRRNRAGGEGAAKEKFMRFFDLLEGTKERHQLARVLEDDAEWRKMLEDEVVELVVPSLQRFTQKMREEEFSKSECDRRPPSDTFCAERSICGSCRSFEVYVRLLCEGCMRLDCSAPQTSRCPLRR